MLGNFVVLIILVAFVVLFAWLARRAWKAKRGIIKWPGVIVAGLLTLIFAFVAIVYGKGLFDLYRQYPVAAANVSVASSPEKVARGEHLATILCAGCHSTTGELPLSGGHDMVGDIGIPLGTIVSSNLTPAGVIKNLSDSDIYRILRTGIAPDGRITFMAGINVRKISDDDTQAIIAYLRQSPPVQNETPPFGASPLAVLFAGAGFLFKSVPSTIQPVSAPPKAASKDYGAYIANFMDCRSCHGPTLSADGGPLAPPGASNLTVVVPEWSKDDFFKAMRTGVDSTGHQISAPMPWQTIGKLDDVELAALYEYLHGLTPITKK